MIADRYELEHLLGRGGMADVYLATDRRLSRKVAVKMLHRNFCGDEDLLARFSREANSSARLNHPSIVQVYDSGGEVEGNITLPYIVMEYIPGRTLRDVLNENKLSGKTFDPEFVVDPQQTKLAAPTAVGSSMTRPPELASPRTEPLDIEQAISLTSGVLLALGYSHRKGIVHRDIKPGNVMLSEAGDVKVMDFGIARATTEATAAMTRTNAVVGTAQYMSPEQAKGEPVDSRSDIYSTGCLLYELLTGRPPFMSETAVSLAYKHVGEAPTPPSSFNPRVSESLDRVVMKSLAKDRQDRYQDAESFRADLRAAQAGRPVSAASFVVEQPQPTEAMGAVPNAAVGPYVEAAPMTQDRPRRRRTGFIVLVVATIAVLIGGLAGVVWFNNRTPPVTMVTIPDVYEMSLAEAKQQLTGAGLSPKTGATVASDEVDKGRVVSQNPESRLVKPKGTEVVLTMSGGPAQVKVPKVAGMTQEAARAALDKAGLNPRNAEIANSATVKTNQVIKTSPAAGKPVLRGSAVDLTVSSGLVDLDDLTGKSLGNAKKWLADRGLTATVRYRDSKSRPGNVIAQNPVASPVPQESTVILYIAQRRKPTPSPTPSTTQPSSPTESPSSSAPTSSETSTDG